MVRDWPQILWAGPAARRRRWPCSWFGTSLSWRGTCALVLWAGPADYFANGSGLPRAAWRMSKQEILEEYKESEAIRAIKARVAPFAAASCAAAA